jgi:bifunctional non-homologous end joining protein LigD
VDVFDLRDCLVEDYARYTRSFIKIVDRALRRTLMCLAKRGRERKILIDYLRNNRTNTSICAFSPRARAGATVSVPLNWDDLNAPPGRWALTTVPQRLKRLRVDPWARYWTAAQEISDASFAAVQVFDAAHTH